MIYISLANDKDEAIPENYRNFPQIIKDFIYFVRSKRGCLLEQKIEGKTLVVLPKINKKILNKLEHYIKVKCVKSVCIDKTLKMHEDFNVFLKGQAVKILDGRWLFKQLMMKVIEYIAQNKKELLAYQEVSILTNDIDEILVDHIMEIANRVKLLNIVTMKEAKFKKIEQTLYEENGILLNIHHNYKKSLQKSDIIINVDFSEEEINKYDIPKKACLVHLKEDIKMTSKSFRGVNACFYEVSMPRKYIKYLMYFRNFNTSELYESFIYKHTTTQNIKKEIEEDGLNIIFLSGKSGKIRKQEYSNLSKKMIK